MFVHLFDVTALGLTMVVLKQSELNELLLRPPDGCRLESYEPLMNWVIMMEGPEAAPAPGYPRLYENELFRYHYCACPWLSAIV
jgi:hypothetical protein